LPLLLLSHVHYTTLPHVNSCCGLRMCHLADAACLPFIQNSLLLVIVRVGITTVRVA